MMAPSKRQVKATRHLICSYSNWVNFVKYGCKKSWAEVHDERDARESSLQPGRRLRGGKVTDRRETGQKETRHRETGRKETRRKEMGGKTMDRRKGEWGRQ